MYAQLICIYFTMGYGMNKPAIIWPKVIVFVVTFLVAVVAVPYRAFTYVI